MCNINNNFKSASVFCVHGGSKQLKEKTIEKKCLQTISKSEETQETFECIDAHFASQQGSMLPL